MKKLLLSGITAVALMAAGNAQAGGLSLQGETGVARTPLAMSLPPMSFAIAADYVGSDAPLVPVRAEIGLPFGIEVGGSYSFLDMNNDPKIWSLNAKWVLPKFVEGLGLAVGGHYYAQSFDGPLGGTIDNDGYDFYSVVTYVAKMGEGMALIPSAGLEYYTLTGSDAAEDNAIRFFGSLLFKAPMFAFGGEYKSVDEDFEPNLDGNFWVGGRVFLGPMFTLQAGYLNNVNWDNDNPESFGDGVFHLGAQFAFSSAK
jgi:hypothetical protein